MERPLSSIFLESVEIGGRDQDHRMRWDQVRSTLSRWQHGFESRWGCSVALTPFV